MKIGTRVRKIGKKRTAYVRRVRHTCAGLEVELSNPLGGFTFWMAYELEVV